ICQDIARRLNAFLDSEPETPLLRQVQAQTRVALGVISTALERYSLEEISLSYNGGKDCLVLLLLLLASLAHHPSSALPTKLQSVYIISPFPFAEVDEFVDGSIDTYSLDLARYTLPMKEAFRVYLGEHEKVKAILVGTRRTDPHGELLTHFDQTDHGWPAFMRVHPVIDWHYAEIWAFIRHLEIPYCILYDRGYTSLGGTTDTHPNPALKAGNVQSETKEQSFRPAYELVEDKAERLGRDW
ncbi:putative FAD synthase, partial [Lachnellula subtilissima]